MALKYPLKSHIPWNKGLKGFMKGRVTSEETKIKMSLSQKGIKRPYMSGKKHWAWKEDRSLIKKRDERNDPAYLCWCRDIKMRDNWKCRINNKDCNGKIIVHHILPWRDYPELRYNINNGITLCHAHHPRKRAEEKRLIPIFQGLVPVSNIIICH